MRETLWHWITATVRADPRVRRARAGRAGGRGAARRRGVGRVHLAGRGRLTVGARRDDSAVSGGWSAMRSVDQRRDRPDAKRRVVGVLGHGRRGPVGGLGDGRGAQVRAVSSSRARRLDLRDVTGPVTSMIKGGLGIGSPSTITSISGRNGRGLKKGLKFASRSRLDQGERLRSRSSADLKGAVRRSARRHGSRWASARIWPGLEVGWSQGVATGGPRASASAPRSLAAVGRGLLLAGLGIGAAAGTTINVYPQPGRTSAR